MCVGLWINERTSRCQSQSGIDRIDSRWVFPWRRRQRRATFHRQYFQIHLSLFRSVCAFRSYPLCRGLLTHSCNRSRSPPRTYHHHQKGIHYFRAGYLCAGRWSDRSRTCYDFRTSGCNHCAFKSINWVGNLSGRGSLGFHLKNVEPCHRWGKVTDFY